MRRLFVLGLALSIGNAYAFSGAHASAHASAHPSAHAASHASSHANPAPHAVMEVHSMPVKPIIVAHAHSDKKEEKGK